MSLHRKIRYSQSDKSPGVAGWSVARRAAEAMVALLCGPQLGRVGKCLTVLQPPVTMCSSIHPTSVGCQNHRAWVLALSFASCVILGRLLTFSNLVLQ